MEKVWQAGIWAVAVCIALVLLTTGYKKLTQPKTKIKWVKELSIAVIAVIVFLDLSACNKSYLTTEKQLPEEGIPPTCYQPMPFPTKRDEWIRLNNQVPLLEKAYADGKINDQTYQKIILNIKEDLKVLDENGKPDTYFDEYKKEHNLTDEDIEALKKKARELIEKIEKK